MLRFFVNDENDSNREIIKGIIYLYEKFFWLIFVSFLYEFFFPHEMNSLIYSFLNGI